METVLIAGGTGLVGKQLSKMLLQKGHEVVVLTRNAKPSSSSHNIRYAGWDPEKQEIDKQVFDKATAIINLAGANIAEKRWTAKRKKVLEESRVKAGETIVHNLRNTPNKIHTVVNASAQGWYGEDSQPGAVPFKEEQPAASDFLGSMCKSWEDSIAPVTALGKRLVYLRTGLVMGKDGGALKEFLKPVNFGIAPVMGSGKQMQSWIHIDDICRLYINALENKDWTGPFNAASPKPVTNVDLIKAIAYAKKGAFFLTMKIPAWLLKIMLGQMSEELLKSVSLSTDKARNGGFQFIYPSVEAAMANLLGNN